MERCRSIAAAGAHVAALSLQHLSPNSQGCSQRCWGRDHMMFSVQHLLGKLSTSAGAGHKSTICVAFLLLKAPCDGSAMAIPRHTRPARVLLDNIIESEEETLNPAASRGYNDGISLTRIRNGAQCSHILLGLCAGARLYTGLRHCMH